MKIQYRRRLLIDECEASHERIVQGFPVSRVPTAEVNAELLSLAIRLCSEKPSLKNDRMILPARPRFSQWSSIFGKIDLRWALCWSTMFDSALRNCGEQWNVPCTTMECI